VKAQLFYASAKKHGVDTVSHCITEHLDIQHKGEKSCLSL